MTEWQTKKLGDIGTFAKGAGIPKDSAQSGDLPAVRYGELYTSFDVFVKKPKSYIDQTTANTSTKIMKGDVLFAGSGETIDEIGKSAVYRLDQAGYAGGDIIVLRPDSRQDASFLGYALNSEITRKELRRLGQGQSVVHIYRKDLETLELSLPKKPEQERIVAVLEIWDEYIEKLERKIALKEQLKKGLMQQLLTGERRLTGFNEEWKKVHLKDLVNVDSGYGFPERLQGRLGLRYPFIKVSDMNLPKNKRQILSWNNSINEEDRISIHARAFPAGSIVFPKIGAAINTNKKRILTLPTLIDNNVMALIPRDTRDTSYLYAWVMNFDLKRWANDSGVPSIRKSEVESHLIFAPTSIEERSAIGAVFNSTQYEIESLTEIRNNILRQKKFLLKNLITGAIRTPETLILKGTQS